MNLLVKVTFHSGKEIPSLNLSKEDADKLKRVIKIEGDVVEVYDNYSGNTFIINPKSVAFMEIS